jgi:hypothetical protein
LDAGWLGLLSGKLLFMRGTTKISILPKPTFDKQSATKICLMLHFFKWAGGLMLYSVLTLFALSQEQPKTKDYRHQEPIIVDP